MRANRRGQRVRAGRVHYRAIAAVFALALAAVTSAQDSGQIHIRLTVPTRISARADAAPPVAREHRVCIASHDSVPFSVASLTTNDGSWQLRPLAATATARSGDCAGVTVSLAATTANRVTLVLSPQ